MADNKYQEKHRIVYYETDVTGRVGLGQLVDLLMLASYDHSKAENISEEWVNEQGYGWVITQHLLEIKRLPKKDEVITLETQATSYNRYFCYRDFFVYDKQGELLAKMHTAFVLMDLTTRKIARIEARFVAPYGVVESRKLERLAAPEKLIKVDAKKNYRVRYWDIDTNQHVNNVHYFEWMLDALPKEFLMTHEPCAVNIKYEHELHYGDESTSLVQVDEKNKVTLHEIKNGATLSCSAQIKWRTYKA
ncbi:acyl-ACP thioesterase domain-containing protein [Ligilactobacillus faecis]|uniref:Acyl-ACP thioesterase domain-containing protein n=1 Tax=Ligilactobacillus faecis TaxID=762833 RepID=A0ABV4DMQ5_9LACO